MRVRRVASVLRSRPKIEGAGVHLKRAFGFHQVPRFDPFLLLDDFHTGNPSQYMAGFPWHPHRGIETVTYILEGLVEHGDSLGNRGVIGPGEVQWMTAGGGIIHQEMPRLSPTGMLWGFQLWVNLPAANKMMPPRYREVKAADIPEAVLEGGVRARVISGAAGGRQGPVRDIVMSPTFLDVSVPAEAGFGFDVPDGHTVFVYVLEGRARFEGPHESHPARLEGEGWDDPDRAGLHGPETVVLLERAGDRLEGSTEDQPARFLVLCGAPLGEPVAWHGPIVMNTQAELDLAFEQFRSGTFVRTG
jgi:quercetin 2,3-dioxygenase